MSPTIDSFLDLPAAARERLIASMTLAEMRALDRELDASKLRRSVSDAHAAERRRAALSRIGSAIAAAGATTPHEAGAAALAEVAP